MNDSPDAQTMSRRRALAMATATAATAPAVPVIAGAAADEDEGPLTAEQAAAIEFEPWVREPGGWTPPSREEWLQLENPYLVTLRIAHAFMFKTKAELVEIVEKIDEEAGQSLYEGFRNTVGYFEMLLTILKDATGSSNVLRFKLDEVEMSVAALRDAFASAAAPARRRSWLALRHRR